MQTEIVDTGSNTGDLVESQAEPQSAEAGPYAQALAELESLVANLQAAFSELANLESQQQELERALDQAAADEKLILADHDATEGESVKRLVAARARKDLRAERLLAHKRRVANHCAIIIHDMNPRLAFSRFAHSLVVAKQAEISAVCNAWWPTGSVAGFDTQALVRASMPYIKTTQVTNFCTTQPRQDSAQEMEELKELPRHWLRALDRLTKGEDPFHA